MRSLLPLLFFAITSAASAQVDGKISVYCEQLLSSASGTDEVIAVYSKLLTEVGSDLVTIRDLETMLKSGDYFTLGDGGSSARDHLQEALDKIRAVVQPDGNSAGDRLRTIVEDLLDQRTGNRRAREKEEKRRKFIFTPYRIIKVPEVQNQSLETTLLGVAPCGNKVLLEQKAKLAYNTSGLYVIDVAPRNAPRQIALQIPDVLKHPTISAQTLFSEDGSLLTLVSYKSAFLFDANNGSLLSHHELSGHIRDVAISPDNATLILRSDTPELREWFVVNRRNGKVEKLMIPGELETSLRKHSSAYGNDSSGSSNRLKTEHYRITFSPHGCGAALQASVWEMAYADPSYQNFVVFWDLKTHLIIDEISRSRVSNPVSLVKFSPDGLLALIDDSWWVTIRNLTNRTESARLAVPGSGYVYNVSAAAFTKDSKQVAAVFQTDESATETFFALWDARSGQLSGRRYPGLSEPTTADMSDLAFSEDGLHLYHTLGHGRVKRMFRIPGGIMVRRYEPLATTNQLSLGNGAKDGSVYVELIKTGLKVWDIDGALEESK